MEGRFDSCAVSHRLAQMGHDNTCIVSAVGNITPVGMESLINLQCSRRPAVEEWPSEVFREGVYHTRLTCKAVREVLGLFLIVYLRITSKA